METTARKALEGFVDMLMDAICVVDTEGRYVYVSAAFERIFGYSPQELIGTQMLDLVHPDDRVRTLAAASDIMAGNPRLHFENRYLHKQGHVVHVMWSARWSPVDRLRIAVARDVTGLKRAETLRVTLLEISEAAYTCQDLASLFARIHQVLAGLLTARDLAIALRAEPEGPLAFVYHSNAQRTEAPQALIEQIAGHGQPLRTCHQLGVPLQTAGAIIGALLIGSGDGGAVYTANDEELLQLLSSQIAAAIERRQLYERLQEMARYDQLTRLANRMLLQERLQHAVEQAARHNDRLAVLYLDLDRFKQVNDSLGHAAGDALLQEVARRLKGTVREQDTVARIGGDEFVVLIERIAEPSDAWRVVAAIRQALTPPMVLEGQSMSISASIGVACYPEDAEDLAQLFRYADQAMYKAKKRGAGR